MRPFYIFLAVAILCATSAGAAEPGRSSYQGRTLFLLLDAVPYSLLERLTDPARGKEQLFRDFSRPVALISTFPSTTTIAVGEAFEPLGLRPSPGYEARFFDREKGKVRGGGPFSYFKIEFPWRSFFDWSRKGVVRSAMAGLRALKVSGKRVERVVRDFVASDDREFFAYIDTTDLAAHTMSPGALEPALRRLDQAVIEARRNHPKSQFRVVIFSDHGIAGGAPLQNVLPAIKQRLRQADYRLTKRLRRPQNVALTPFGLVSSLEAYTATDQAPRVAEILAALEGVDLCVYRKTEANEANAWVVVDDEGKALIERRLAARGFEWAYRHLSSDPLGYGPVAERLHRIDEEAENDWHPDEAWFAATSEKEFPDALYRIARSFELVTNPASVICSCAPGHMFGSKKTERAAFITKGRLEWTHGALFWEATAGFLMTDDPNWQVEGPLRIGRAFLPFVSGKGRGVSTKDEVIDLRGAGGSVRKEPPGTAPTDLSRGGAGKLKVSGSGNERLGL